MVSCDEVSLQSLAFVKVCYMPGKFAKDHRLIIYIWSDAQTYFILHNRLKCLLANKFIKGRNWGSLGQTIGARSLSSREIKLCVHCSSSESC